MRYVHTSENPADLPSRQLIKPLPREAGGNYDNQEFLPLFTVSPMAMTK
jgi:hypothetical protein